jgi:outer membrane protein TolC
VQAQSDVKVAGEAVRIASDYEAQVRRAVDAGIAFAGDAYRIQTQVAANQLAQRRAREMQRIAAARLAQVLHLDPAVDLVATDEAVGPLKLGPVAGKLDALVERALRDRPELHMTAAQREAARNARDGAKYAPLVPSVIAQYSYGGLAGGTGTDVSNFGESSDYGIALAWKVGPGGLFDRARVDTAESRLRSVELEDTKLRDRIRREVVESFTKVGSLGDQLAISERILASAQKTLDLSRERKEFGVGIVAETIQSEQDLTRARREYLGILARYNQACFTLRWAVGAMREGK